jgi:hypothetical protein
MDSSEFSKQWQELEDNKKPLIEQKNNISNSIERLNYYQNKLKKEYLENNAFSVGTKVTLNRIYANTEYVDTKNGGYYLIYEVHLVGLMSNPTIDYHLTKAKKDGSLPLKQLDGLSYIGHSDLIEGWV